MSADKDALHATIETLKIFESSNYFRSKTNLSFSEKEDIESDLELLNSSLAGDSHNFFSCQETSDFEKNVLDDHKLNYMEVKEIVEKISLVYEMYKHYLQQTKKFQEDGDISCIQKYSADVMNTSNVSQKIDQIESTVHHIKIIAAEGAKLKQVLRSNVLNDVWKINKNYHKAVVNFFKLASKLVSYIESFVHSLETSKRYNHETTIILKNKEIKVLAVLNENMDVLTDFQNYVQKYIDCCKAAEEDDSI